MKLLLNLKSAVLALVLTVTLLGHAHAQAWIPPTLEQVGVPYYRYVSLTYTSGQTPYLPGGASAAAVLSFGPNVAGYAFNTSEGVATAWTLQQTGGAQQAYYDFLGNLLSYQNYLNPTYAQQLEDFYDSYGGQLFSYYLSVASFYQNYYSANALYYENLIF